MVSRIFLCFCLNRKIFNVKLKTCIIDQNVVPFFLSSIASAYFQGRLIFMIVNETFVLVFRLINEVWTTLEK